MTGQHRSGGEADFCSVRITSVAANIVIALVCDRSTNGGNRAKRGLTEELSQSLCQKVVERSGSREYLVHLVLLDELALVASSVHANLLVVFFEGGKVFASFGELPLLHSLSDIPVDEGALRVEQVELAVEAGPGSSDGSGVSEHAQRTGDLCEVAARDECRWLVTNTNLEAGGAPVDELDRPLRLDSCNRRVDVLWDDVTTVQEAAGHELSVTGVTLDHLVSLFEGAESHLSNRVLLVEGLFSRDDGCVGGEGEVNSREGDQVGLKLVKVDIEGSIESERGSNRRDDLGNEAIKIGVAGALDAEVLLADVVDCLIVDHEGTV